jgi:hypothetical protein
MDERTDKAMLEGAEGAAQALGVRLQFVEARGPADFERAFSDMTMARVGALTVRPAPMFIIERRRLVELTAKNRVPAVYAWSEFVDAGGLMAYGPNFAELLRELIPGLTRIGLLINAADPFAKPFVDEAQVAAKRTGVQIHTVDVRRPQEIDAAFAAMAKQRAGAVIVQGVLTASAWQAGDLAVRHRLPSLSVTKQFAESGGLMSYSASFTDTYRRAASYVDRILKGAKPGDLAIEQPTRFELVINLKTAKALGLTIPQSLLARADEIIQ